MPVAERLYYADSFLKNFTAIVTDVREVSRSDGESIWQLSLDRTAFYPTSGGQPFDTGVLRATSRGGASLDVPIESVEEDENGEVWHFVRKPLATGTAIEAEIHWDRRFDHMQQHTGQHLLSAIFLSEAQAPTVSFHLGDEISTIDLSCGPPSTHTLDRIERLANEVICDNRAVLTRHASREEAEAMLAAGHLRKLPERAGAIRIVEIAGVEHNACGGTHVGSTGHIGALLIRGTEKVSRGVRVEFVCGLRAVRAARADHAVLAQITTALSAGAAEIPAAVERLKGELKTGVKERQRLREDLADYHASRLAVEVPIRDGLRLVDRSWKDRDRDYIKLLASRLAATSPSTVAILCAEELSPTRIILARSLDLDFNCGAILKDALAQHGLRGGGSADLAQGDVPPQNVPAVRAALAAAIHALVPLPPNPRHS
jgi:alanyl-tRNA synthetase